MNRVLVLGHHGELMNPCNPARARQLLKNNRARKVMGQPFTIQLLPAHKSIHSVTFHVEGV